jgi:hypothetical protein
MGPQTPEELQWISNLAHWIEGGVFAIVAVLAFLQTLGYAQSKGLRYLWPGLILLAGIFLPILILLQRGFDGIGTTWDLVVRDPQQREHFLMATLLLVAGWAEVLIRTEGNRSRLWRFVAPAAFTIIGVLFFFHTEYGTPEAIAEAVRKHRYMGLAILLAGLFKVADVLWQKRFGFLAFPWIAMLAISALLLMTYREPPGAYRNTGEDFSPRRTNGFLENHRRKTTHATIHHFITVARSNSFLVGLRHS